MGMNNTYNDLNSRIDCCIYRGLEFLHKNQLPYGEFKTYVSPNKNMDSGIKYVSTTYTTTFVLYSLSFMQNPIVEEITQKGVKFLLEEMESPGIWRFFSTNRSIRYSGGKLERYTPLGIAPDLDDTACASFCLRQNGVELPSNHDVFLNNRDEEGLFYTWLMDIPKRAEYDDAAPYQIPSGNDICCGVNANVLLYLGENKKTGRSCGFINDIISKGLEKKYILYFPDRLCFYYLVSRTFFNGVFSLDKSKEAVVEFIFAGSRDKSCLNNKLMTAYEACILMNFGVFDNSRLTDRIRYLTETQNSDGSWPKERFCDEPVRCFGSEELTTAICLEALARYSSASVY